MFLLRFFFFNIYKCWLIVFIDTLAMRLENEMEGEYSMYASLCYICSGNLENLVQNWLNNTESQNSPIALEVCCYFSFIRKQSFMRT